MRSAWCGVQIPWGETVPALASGAVVGVTTSSVSGVDGKFWEFLKYFYRTNHVWSSQILTVNNDCWKSSERGSPEGYHGPRRQDGAGVLERFDQGRRGQHQPPERGRHGGGAGDGCDDDGYPHPRPRRCSRPSSSACRRRTSRCGPISPKSSARSRGRGERAACCAGKPQRGGASAAAHPARRDRSPRPARRLDRRRLPADADGVDARRGRDAFAVESACRSFLRASRSPGSIRPI